ncbi:tRNA (guanosine(46)-N7)-methyltransferase TrmB [Paenibacillus sp. PK4536]|jgi:tRNA (guanine-N7-)-methyltransferase|uniref:tRNA (guanosine(46)-N7)-methyltransferase TrmB n=1 Tax=Paenibacillus TaxID=44249 RepID=UPI0010BFD080|nr:MULTISPECIES: tRNA (guanosine(46)-N7)-methyltransferase TrmB [Paenibacillus]TKJ92100.1 tRNA (guanosine(46)-N7)-methyltransferase TrmB [Paenibacillus sp. CFBP13512]WIM37370.1 tRNA (guanosine(46)-N7)-methyltransferase TrmB [Paenibacillus sp. PK4536]CAJ1316097.1 tRNA (guanosine(46)-N7)-methyltransferase TrmB [Paenibacillus nuruki]
MRLRGRKGIREGLEQQEDLVVLNPEQYKGKWQERFDNDLPIHVEFGMGKGRFVSQMSVKHPNVNYIGFDMYDELVRRASEKTRIAWEEAERGEPTTIQLARANIEKIEEVFAPGEIERIYLNFSDPWPKKKHGRRRLTHPRFLEMYCKLLNARGEIHFKTDSETLFEFSLNSFADYGLQMTNLSLNLHRDGINEEHVMTEYEAKFMGKGMNIHRCEVLIGEEVLREYQAMRLDKY